MAPTPAPGGGNGEDGCSKPITMVQRLVLAHLWDALLANETEVSFCWGALGKISALFN